MEHLVRGHPKQVHLLLMAPHWLTCVIVDIISLMDSASLVIPISRNLLSQAQGADPYPTPTLVLQDLKPHGLAHEQDQLLVSSLQTEVAVTTLNFYL